MKIGFLQIIFRIPSCPSLKAKRSILKRHINFLRRTFNIGIAELDDHDDRSFCTLGIVTISRDGDMVDRTFQRVITYFETASDVQLMDYTIETF